RGLAGVVDVAPRQHDRSPAHRLAAQLLVVGVDDAVFVLDLASRDDSVFMDDDADEAVEPAESEGERGQARLGGDRDRHLVADDQAARTAELLLGEKERRYLAQGCHLCGAARGKERKAHQRQLPERIGDRASLERASAPPALPPAGHGAAARPAVSGAMRTKPLALQRMISARGLL